jgi:hypothetical protein
LNPISTISSRPFEAVCDLFRRQEICRTEFTVTKNALDGALLPGMERDLGSLYTDDLRDRERAKIQCGERHFDELPRGENPARFVKATSLDDVLLS